MRRTWVATLVAGLALLLATPGALAAEERQDARTSFLTTEDLAVVREVTLEDEEAAELREFIDEALGDDDDDVDDWEVDEYEDWFRDSQVGTTARDHILNGETGKIVGTSISTSGVTGEASFERRQDPGSRSTSTRDDEIDDNDDSGDPLDLRIRESIAFKPLDIGFEDTLSYHYTNTTDDSTITFQAPPGFSITRTAGLSSVDFQGDQRRLVSGDMSEDDSVNVRFRLATGTSSFPDAEDFLGPNAKFPSTSTTLSFQESLRNADATTSYEISGFDVIGLKGLIDQLGNSDGAVQESEVSRVINDLENDLTGTASEVFFVDGDAGRLTSVSIDTSGLAGDVNTQTRVTVQQTSVLAFRVDQDQDRAFDREPGLSDEERQEEREENDEFVEPFAITIGKTARGSDVRVSLPSDYEFREDATSGLGGAVFSTSYGQVEGSEASEDAVVLFADRLDPDKDEVAYGVDEDQALAAGFGLAGGIGLLALVGVGFGYAGTSRLGTLIDRVGGDDGPPAAGAASTGERPDRPDDRMSADQRAAERRAAEGPGAHPETHERDPDEEGPEVSFSKGANR